MRGHKLLYHNVCKYIKESLYRKNVSIKRQKPQQLKSKTYKDTKKSTNTNHGEEMMLPRFARMIVLKKFPAKNRNQEIINMTSRL
jgi:hypothetical protein